MLPEASHFALPRALTQAGVRRYGFHGLSYRHFVPPGGARATAAGRSLSSIV